MALFNVLFDIQAKTASFESSMRAVEQRIDSIAETAKRAGAAIGIAFSLEGVGDKIMQAVDAGEELYKTMQKTGASAEALSGLKFAAGEAGVSFDQVSAAISKMQRSISQGGSLFAQIGVDLARLKTLSPDQQFEAIAEAINRLKDPTDRARAAIAVFGKSGAELLPLLLQGAGGIEKLRAEAAAMGLTLSGDTVKGLHEADEAIKKMEASVSHLWTTMASKAAPAIAGFSDWLRQVLGGATEVEKLTSRLAILEGMRKSLTMTGSVLGDPKAYAQILTEIDSITAKLGELHAAAGAEGSTPGGGAAAPASIENVLTKALGFGPDQLQEFHITASKQEKDVGDTVKQFYEGLGEQTAGDVERLENKIKEFQGKIAILLQAGLITPAIAQQRTNEFNANNVLPDLSYYEPQLKLVQTEHQQTLTAMVDAQHAASVQMAGAFESFFADPLKTGFKGLLKAFITTIDQMVAKEATLSLFGGNSTSGALGGIFSTLFSSFGGMRAQGGALSSGKWYIAGENGPEPIWGGGSGAFAGGSGASAGGGSGPITIQNQVDARGATVDAIQMLPGAMKQASDSAVQRIVDMKARGQF
jgi:hypothetical protein